jgi:hypothetical protein
LDEKLVELPLELLEAVPPVAVEELFPELLTAELEEEFEEDALFEELLALLLDVELEELLFVLLLVCD